jgi:carboxyl-terminal processing protease
MRTDSGPRLISRALVAAASLAALSCGSSSPTTPDDATGGNCSNQGQVQTVRATLRDWYFWYQQLPDPDPAGFTSPDAYLEAVRYRPLDASFSYVALKAESDAFFSDSQFVGYGFRSTLVAADELRAADVYANSPASRAGLDRGSRFLEIGGRTVADLVASGQLGSAFGPNQVGITTRVRFLDRAGAEHEATLVKELVTIPTVSVEEIHQVGGRTVGYLMFENFVRPSTEALNATFGRFKEAGVDEVVLDLRYNGGGLINVAQHLGGLIGGAATADRTFVRYVHNDKQSSRNSAVPFPLPANALGIERLVVIATRSSASASELVVNALRPFMPVTIVGDRTYGKPVGQYGFDFCDKTLFPVAFATRNASDEGDYFGGLPVDCPAPDDIGHALGDADEGSLAAALDFIRTGQCSAVAATQARAQGQRRPPLAAQPHRGDGWRELLGSF